MQLNTPYPSGAYLGAFFKKLNLDVHWDDLNIDLYYSIFSKAGLEKLFELSTEAALKMIKQSQKSGDEASTFNLQRYISTKDSWIKWIDGINAILCSSYNGISGRELCHSFIFNPHAPRGARMEQFLSNLNREATIDDARFLASFALADLADYITACFDSNFSLVRYAESLTINETSFSQIEKAIDSPVLNSFYLPLLEQRYGSIDLSNYSNDTPFLICISVPFPGTFTAALFTGRFFKQKFGNKVFVCIGGGFVNTELRQADDIALSRYIDAISYDRGYGSYKALLDSNFLQKTSGPFYKLRIFKDSKHIPPLEDKNSLEYKELCKFEEEMTFSIVPDYSDIDFSRYPRVCDDTNPMHRLWSDGTWLKAYLAHGCYWHQCTFCDVTLDYVCGYRNTDISAVYKGLLSTAKDKGIYGVHFVDEALPPRLLSHFARLNAQDSSPLLYWGNVRFEKVFSRDLADFLSYAGLTGVSAGMEIATGKGLENLHKGTDLDSIVSACCAFKEAGILIHAYMIYGYWQESAQDLINSMETLRQFFEQGLLDSAFWHKFVLTRHSRAFAEWQQGKNPDLHPIFTEDSQNKSIFAKNGLHFKGEEKSQKYGLGLNYALEQWMHGEQLKRPVQNFFDFSVPAPQIPKNLIEKAIERYEKRRNDEYKIVLSDLPNLDGLFWLASKPIALNKRTLVWFYMQEEFEYQITSSILAQDLAEILWKLNPTNPRRKQCLDSINKQTLVILQEFRAKGLCLLPKGF